MNSESVMVSRLGRGRAGESWLQGGHPGDVSGDSGKGACAELALRWLPVGRGRPESAAAVKTASRVNSTCWGWMLPTAAIIRGAGFLLAVPLWGGPFEPKRVCSLGEGGGACLCGSLALSALSSHLEVLSICPRGLCSIPRAH